jgi:hypothetical protein
MADFIAPLRWATSDCDTDSCAASWMLDARSALISAGGV